MLQLSSYASSRKTNEPNLKKSQKNLILAQIWAPKLRFYLYCYTLFQAIILFNLNEN